MRGLATLVEQVEVVEVVTVDHVDLMLIFVGEKATTTKTHDGDCAHLRRDSALLDHYAPFGGNGL